MKIIKLQAENIKRLKAIEIIPTENAVIISGKNGQGKTSVLDAIWLALAGGKASREMIRPVRDGERKAIVKLDLGDITVTRTWTSNDRSALAVENKEGAAFKKPQEMLDNLVGRLSFDPLAFAHQDNKTQLKTMLEMVKLPVAPAVLDAKKTAIYDQRRDVNRDVKQYESKLGLTRIPDLKAPDKEISAAAVLDELKAAQDQKAANDENRRKLNQMLAEASACKDGISELNEQIKDIQLKRDNAQSTLAGMIAEGKAVRLTVDKLVDPDINSFREKLANIEVINQAVRDKQEYLKTKGKVSELNKESDDFTTQIDAINAEKDKMLKEAKFPIDGLGFDDDGVTFGSIPFKQCSSAEQLKVSVAMAMALNPNLRVIRITDGSLLDGDNMALIKAMAKDKDFQIWIEQVSDSGKVGVYIEDGEVKADNQGA